MGVLRSYLSIFRVEVTGREPTRDTGIVTASGSTDRDAQKNTRRRQEQHESKVAGLGEFQEDTSGGELKEKRNESTSI